MSFAKVLQVSGITKQNTEFLFFIPERSTPYLKVLQVSGKIAQASAM